jgi:hypothetical protein
LPLPVNRRFRRARASLDSVIYRIIEERRASGTDRGDLLSMLLLAQDEESDTGGMTDEQLRDEVMTIFLAGHETTANALAWTWYLLAQNPEAESKLHAEIDSVLMHGRLPTIQDLPQLRYTEMILAEAMRLYPPAWVIGRLAIKDYAVGEYVAEAGTLILLSQYVMHRDPRFYPDPLRFDPERWTAEAKDARLPYTTFLSAAARGAASAKASHGWRGRCCSQPSPPLAHASCARPHCQRASAHHASPEAWHPHDDGRKRKKSIKATSHIPILQGVRKSARRELIFSPASCCVKWRVCSEHN